MGTQHHNPHVAVEALTRGGHAPQKGAGRAEEKVRARAPRPSEGLAERDREGKRGEERIEGPTLFIDHSVRPMFPDPDRADAIRNVPPLNLSQCLTGLEVGAGRGETKITTRSLKSNLTQPAVHRHQVVANSRMLEDVVFFPGVIEPRIYDRVFIPLKS